MHTKPIAHYLAVFFIISIGLSMHYATIQSVASAQHNNGAQTMGSANESVKKQSPFLLIYSKTAKVEHSFYKTAKILALSNRQRIFVMDMFRSQIDYNRDFRKGDTVTILYQPGANKSKKISQGTIVAVDIKLGKRRFLAMSNAVKIPRIFDRDEVVQIPYAKTKNTLKESAFYQHKLEKIGYYHLNQKRS